MHLDEIDLRILEIVQENSDLPTKEIASRLNLTVSPVYERIKKLEQEGTIKRYVALVDSAKVERNLVAFCEVSLSQHSQEYLFEFEKAVQCIPIVTETYHITGAYDYLLKVVIKNMDEYQDFIINKLSVLNNVATVQSMFILNTVKHTTAIPLMA
ncbi:MAG: Lrp/AsnC family transcriptional regulator [Cyclobacteriaceae bacterium]|nr:Lrp/AsnC family transcriptional regulator [Cyclobacteriaceae bacterium]